MPKQPLSFTKIETPAEQNGDGPITGPAESGESGESAEPLVNENNSSRVEGLQPGETIEDLRKQIEYHKNKSAERLEENRRMHQRALEAERKNTSVSKESRTLRIFLEIVNGFIARGHFDPEVLAKKPGSEKTLFKHAAGLAEVAHQQIEGRF